MSCNKLQVYDIDDDGVQEIIVSANEDIYIFKNIGRSTIEDRYFDWEYQPVVLEDTFENINNTSPVVPLNPSNGTDADVPRNTDDGEQGGETDDDGPGEVVEEDDGEEDDVDESLVALRAAVGRASPSRNNSDIVYWRISDGRADIEFSNFLRRDANESHTEIVTLDHQLYDLNFVDISPSPGDDLLGWSLTTNDVLLFVNTYGRDSAYDRALTLSNVLVGADRHPDEVGVLTADFDADGLTDLLVYAEDFMWLRNRMVEHEAADMSSRLDQTATPVVVEVGDMLEERAFECVQFFVVVIVIFT